MYLVNPLLTGRAKVRAIAGKTNNHFFVLASRKNPMMANMIMPICAALSKMYLTLTLTISPVPGHLNHALAILSIEDHTVFSGLQSENLRIAKALKLSFATPSM